MKLAVCGASGSGKTSLVEALAAALRLPILVEGMGPIYTAKTHYYALDASASSTDAQLEHALERWMMAFYDWTALRRTQYTEHPGFVADRWEADLLAIWLSVFRRYDPDNATRVLMKRLFAAAEQFDAVIVLPLQTAPVEDVNEAGLTRKQSVTNRVASHALIAGLVTLDLPCPVWWLPGRPMTVEERVAWVQAQLASLPQQA